MLYVKLTNTGTEVTMMVGGVDIKLRKGDNWLKKGLAEFLTTKSDTFIIASQPVECLDDGTPIEKIKANNPLPVLTEDEIKDVRSNQQAAAVVTKAEDEEEAKAEEIAMASTGTTVVSDENAKAEAALAVTVLEESKEKYRKELNEMERSELLKIATIKSIEYKFNTPTQKLVELIVNTITK